METLPGIKPSTLTLPHLSTVPTHLQSDPNPKTNLKASSRGSTTNSKSHLRNYNPNGSGRTSATQTRKLKELREKNYVHLPSNKGTEFCIIQQDTYA